MHAGDALHRQCLEIGLAAVQGLQPLLIDLARTAQPVADAVPRLRDLLLAAARLCSPGTPPAAARAVALAPSSG